jgi:hypothetical protein
MHKYSPEFWTSMGYLVLDYDHSILLPKFASAGLDGARVDSIVLSLFVEQLDTTNEAVHVTINPIDLNTNTVEPGLSQVIEPTKGGWIDFTLPRELFAPIVDSTKRMVIRMVDPNTAMVLHGAGDHSVNVPRMVITHEDLDSPEHDDVPVKVFEDQDYRTVYITVNVQGDAKIVGGDNVEVTGDKNKVRISN